MLPGDGGVYRELLTSSSEKSLQPQEMPAKNRRSRVFMARVGAATEWNSGTARKKKNKRQDAENQSRSTGQNGSSGTFTREGDAGGTCVPLRTCRVGSETSQTTGGHRHAHFYTYVKIIAVCVSSHNQRLYGNILVMATY